MDDISTYLSVLALLLSALASIYARRAWVEGKRANDISLHNNRLKIYRSLDNLHGEVSGNKFAYRGGDNLRDFSILSKEARFYFQEKGIPQTLESIITLCNRLASLAYKLSQPKADANTMDGLKIEYDELHKFTETAFLQAKKLMEKSLTAVS